MRSSFSTFFSTLSCPNDGDRQASVERYANRRQLARFLNERRQIRCDARARAICFYGSLWLNIY